LNGKQNKNLKHGWAWNGRSGGDQTPFTLAREADYMTWSGWRTLQELACWREMFGPGAKLLDVLQAQSLPGSLRREAVGHA
jgi:hypothetical protein